MAYPTDTARKKIIMSAAPFAYVLGFRWAAGTPDVLHLASSNGANDPAAGDIRFLFDNLASATYKLIISSANTSSEYIEIPRADGAVWKFPKNSLALSGLDESVMTETTNDEFASGLAEITLVTNEADFDSVNMTAFINKLKANKDMLFLIVLPTGFNYKGRFQDASKISDGWFYMFGRLSTDIEQQLSGNPSTVSMTFISTTGGYLKDPAGNTTTLEQYKGVIGDFSAIKLKGTGDSFTPVTLTGTEDGDVDQLYLGDAVLKEVAPAA